MNWKLKQPRGQLTLETIGQQFILSGDDLELVGEAVPSLMDEKVGYELITRCMRDKVNEFRDDPDSRKVFTVFGADHPEQHCISALHLLDGNLYVYQRSSDAARLPSDISFLARLAIILGAKELNLFIGSMHFVLRDA